MEQPDDNSDAPGTVFCSKCGKQSFVDSRFCSACGAHLAFFTPGPKKRGIEQKPATAIDVLINSPDNHLPKWMISAVQLRHNPGNKVAVAILTAIGAVNFWWQKYGNKVASILVVIAAAYSILYDSSDWNCLIGCLGLVIYLFIYVKRRGKGSVVWVTALVVISVLLIFCERDRALKSKRNSDAAMAFMLQTSLQQIQAAPQQIQATPQQQQRPTLLRCHLCGYTTTESPGGSTAFAAHAGRLTCPRVWIQFLS